MRRTPIFLYVLVAALLLMTAVNTWQLQRIEAALLRGAPTIAVTSSGSGGSASSAPATTVASGLRFTPEEEAAFADPQNILKRPTRLLMNKPSFVQGGTLKRQTGSDPRGLNPYIANGADVSEYTRFISNRLAYRAPENPDEWRPELATKVVEEQVGLSYVITLRKGVMWHSPTVDWESGRYEWLKGDHELTSDDFAFVFDLLKNTQVGGNAASLRNYIEAFDHYEIIDRYTFRVVFKEKLYINLPTILDLEPLPRWLYMYDEDGQKYDDATWGLKLNEHWYNQKAIGTGPYRFVRWDSGKVIELAKNDNYWGEKPAFNKVLIQVVKDQSTWLRMLKNQELDYTQIQPEQYRTEVLEAKGPYLGETRIQKTQHSEASYFYIGWNMDTAYFSDKRVRQAMTLAFDRAGLVKNVFYSLGDVTTGPFSMQNPCYDKSIQAWPYDLQKAAALLDEAGWKDSDGDGVRDKLINGEKKSFAFTLVTYGGSTEYETLASVYRQALLSIGVKMTPEPLEWSTMLKRMDERAFDAYTGAWVPNWDVDLYQIWHSSEADKPQSSNRIGFRNPDADKLVEALRRAFDPAERVNVCHQFHQLVHEEQPYTFFYQRTRPVLYWDYLNDPEFSLVHPYRDLRFWSFREARP